MRLDSLLPAVGGNDVWSTGKLVRHRGVQYNLQILHFPASGKGLSRRRNGLRIGDELARGLSTGKSHPCHRNYWRTGLGVENPGHDRVVLCEASSGRPAL